MNIKLVADKYRATYTYTVIQNGMNVKTIQPNGGVNDRLISDEEFNDQLATHLRNGYVVQVR